MTFVFPLLLGGLIFAGLPIALHFLIRKKPKLLTFPAFRFLMQKQRSNTRNLRLRHLLLLLLRMLVLALLCLALSRPRVLQETLGISREKPVALMFVFDTSPSMGYKHDGITRLDLAKKRGLELLDELPADCRFLILDTGEPTNAVREEFHGSIDKARQRIQGLTIRDHNGSVVKRLDEATRRLAELDDDVRDLPRVVGVFSDRTRTSWPAASPKPMENIRAYYFDVGVDSPNDLAVTHLEFPRSPRGEMRQAFAHGERIALRALVRSTGKDHEATLVCKIAGKEVRQAFHAAKGEQQTVTLEIDSGAWNLKSGFHQMEVALDTSDALTFNDRRFATLKLRDQPRALVLADDTAKAARFVRALESLLYAVEVRAAGLPGAMDHDVVFLNGVSAPGEPLWAALAAYVEKGGGVCVIPGGDDIQPVAYNTDAAQRVMPARIVRKITLPKEEEARWDPTGDELLHPFLLPYGAWVAEGTSDFLRYPRGAFRYWHVQPTEAAIAVVRYADRNPAIVERLTKGQGKAVLLTTPLERQEPEWTNYHASNTSFYVALAWLCARHLTVEPTNPNLNHSFDESAPPTVRAPIVAMPRYALTGPEVNEEIRFDNRGAWLGDRLARAGNYTLTGMNADKDNARPIARFSINVPAAESDLTRVAVSEIEAVLGKESLVPQDRRTSLVDSLQWSEPIELFPWLLLLLLFFLALENLLANRFYPTEPAA